MCNDLPCTRASTSKNCVSLCIILLSVLGASVVAEASTPRNSTSTSTAVTPSHTPPVTPPARPQRPASLSLKPATAVNGHSRAQQASKFNSARMKHTNGHHGRANGAPAENPPPPPIPPRERERERDRVQMSNDEADRSLSTATFHHIPPSAPSPPDADAEEAMVKPDLPVKECCRERERTRVALNVERDALRDALKSANDELALKKDEMTAKLGELNRSYSNSLSEMKNLLTTQRRVGNQWKGEMEILTQRFEVKVKALQAENRDLKVELDRLKAVVKDKEAEADEAKELNGIYSAKLTKLDRKFKKLKDEDEESYMEMTF